MATSAPTVSSVYNELGLAVEARDLRPLIGNKSREYVKTLKGQRRGRSKRRVFTRLSFPIYRSRSKNPKKQGNDKKATRASCRAKLDVPKRDKSAPASKGRRSRPRFLPRHRKPSKTRAKKTVARASTTRPSREWETFDEDTDGKKANASAGGATRVRRDSLPDIRGADIDFVSPTVYMYIVLFAVILRRKYHTFASW